KTALQLYSHIYNLLKENSLIEPFIEQEMKMPAVLAAMEIRGIGFTLEPLLAKEKQLKQIMDALESEAEVACGVAVDLNSVQQISNVIYDRLGLVPVRRFR